MYNEPNNLASSRLESSEANPENLSIPIRKPYATPQLIVHGKLDRLTLQAGTPSDPVECTDPGDPGCL